MHQRHIVRTEDGLLAWGVASLGAVAVTALFLWRSAPALEVLYPAAVFVVAVVLYRHHPVSYVGFAWWVVFLTPHVRRLVDYQSGWSQISPIMLAPYLVAGLSALALLRGQGLLRRRAFLPFGLAAAGIAYGYAVGFVRSGPASATFDLLEWIVPVVFGLHTALVWPSYPALRATLQRAFVWGILLMGLYGLVQFFWPPGWDRYWMVHCGMSTIGRPAPFEVRVFSTLNSPGPFGMVMMAGTLLLFAERGVMKRMAVLPSYLSLLLSLVRSAWGGWLVGVLYLLVHARRERRTRLAAALAVLVCAVVAVTLAVPALQTPVADRVGGLSSLQDDRSLQSRLDFLGQISRFAFANPVGMGLGSTGRAAKLSTGDTFSFDNGVANIPYVLGWPGALLFGAGALLLLLEVLRARRRPRDAFVTAAEAVGLAVAAQIVFVNTLVSTVGLLFWCFLGVSVAHRLWADEQQLTDGFAPYGKRGAAAPQDGGNA